MKIICILFHVGKKKNELSRDSIWRLQAGFELAKEDERSVIVFIGGGGLDVSGALLMKKYWIENFSQLKNQCFILDSSNNTSGNLEELKIFLENKEYRNYEVNIISSAYHYKRLEKISKWVGLKVIILSAEMILLEGDDNLKEITDYLNSFYYKNKVMLEWFLRLYLSLDHNQKSILFWRYFSYHRWLK